MIDIIINTLFAVITMFVASIADVLIDDGKENKLSLKIITDNIIDTKILLLVLFFIPFINAVIFLASCGVIAIELGKHIKWHKLTLREILDRFSS